MKYFFLLLFLASCTVMPPGTVNDTRPTNEFLENPKFCNVDADCTCGGIDKLNDQCFVGNKLYQSMYVDVSQQCPDFCTGIGGKLEVKCVDHVCSRVETEMVACTEEAKICPDGTVVVRVGPDCEFEPCPGEETVCSTDADCVPDACCHATGCVHKSQAPLCDAVMCTMNCEPGTLDCGGSCVCQDGECVGQDYFG